MTAYQRVLANVAFEHENRERRAAALMVALGLIVMALKIRRMLGMPETETSANNEVMIAEMQRWREDLTW